MLNPTKNSTEQRKLSETRLNNLQKLDLAKEKERARKAKQQEAVRISFANKEVLDQENVTAEQAESSPREDGKRRFSFRLNPPQRGRKGPATIDIHKHKKAQHL